MIAVKLLMSPVYKPLCAEHRGLDRLLAAAEQQRLRQLKRIYLMQRHAEKQAALTRAQREKEAKDRLREQAMEAAAQRAKAERQLQEALAEVCASLQHPSHHSKS